MKNPTSVGVSNHALFLNEALLNFVAIGRSGGAEYFEDGQRKVHYVLVIYRTSTRKNYIVIQDVLRQLEDLGLEFEQDLGITIPVNFIKIHMNNEVARQLINAYDIQKEYLDDFNYTDPNPRDCAFFKDPLLTRDPFANESIETLSVNKMRIIFRMLKHVSFGPEDDMHGIEKLKRKGIFKAAYPMHDGKIQIEYWHNDDLINERTLLAKYWSSVSKWYKVQPFNMIHKYYGAEIAFYYAWSDFYDKVYYFPLAIIGVLVFMLNSAYFSRKSQRDLEIICNSEIPICGTCIFGSGCLPKPLKTYCGGYTELVRTERYSTIVFSLLSSIWAFVVISLWNRREASLKYRWNLYEENVKEEMEIRIEYKELAKRKIVNGMVTFEIERKIKYPKRFFACLWYIGMVVFVIAFCYLRQALVAAINIAVVKHHLYETVEIDTIIIGLNSTLTALCTIYYAKLVGAIGERMTSAFLPKTQGGYDNILIVLTFSLDIINTFLPLFYTAFLKDSNSNIPVRSGSWFYGYDDCDPYPCLYQLQIQFLIYLTLKTLIEKIFVIIGP
ncbi:unnamed protein product [Brassicogethes aeneus]|nr:unnamed protein product [Brassicogethes aeneus]